MASRGKGRRRREALALRSSRDLLKRGKSGMAKQLPPPPKAQDGEQLLPRSLKRIMALRQGQAGSAQSAGSGSMSGKKRGNKFKMMEPVAVSNCTGLDAVIGTAGSEPTSRTDISGAQPSGAETGHKAAQPAASARDASADATNRSKAKSKQSGRQQDTSGEGPSSGADHLTERQRARRVHQKARQAKKRAKQKGLGGELAGASDDEDALERRLMADRNKPKFGEQAMAPLQTSLKRKHWDGGANARHSALFQQQMRLAAARQQPDEVMRDQVIQAYRQQKRGGADGRNGGVAPVATRASLAALTSKHASGVKHTG